MVRSSEVQKSDRSEGSTGQDQVLLRTQGSTGKCARKNAYFILTENLCMLCLCLTTLCEANFNGRLINL